MSNPLRTPEDYELFLYTLTEHFPSVRHSSLTLIRFGATLARVSGELHFDQGFRLIFEELVTLAVEELAAKEKSKIEIDWLFRLLNQKKILRAAGIVPCSSILRDCQPCQ
jgi:hypothetical protein